MHHEVSPRRILVLLCAGLMTGFSTTTATPPQVLPEFQPVQHPVVVPRPPQVREL